ncbi:hypothetical protein JTE78_12340 [Pseudomonas syringae pv. aptata]|uniref:hypothetical protein n=1 Tax=Pseudomonas syringae TaxID=317 RepID=UPI002041300C|nr:hypothetical protein [Pseudomonas syringae]MCK0543551.1 hypothetical protein [Pseudomonas syringae pv. aptata]
MSDFSTQKGVRARKQHVCSECRGHIHPGASYTLLSGAQDGQGYSFKRCSECHQAFVWLELTLRATPCGMPFDEGIEFGALRCELVEYASESGFVEPESLRHLLGMAERYAAAQNTSEAQ